MVELRAKWPCLTWRPNKLGVGGRQQGVQAAMSVQRFHEGIEPKEGTLERRTKAESQEEEEARCPVHLDGVSLDHVIGAIEKLESSGSEVEMSAIKTPKAMVA